MDEVLQENGWPTLALYEPDDATRFGVERVARGPDGYPPRVERGGRVFRLVEGLRANGSRVGRYVAEGE